MTQRRLEGDLPSLWDLDDFVQPLLVGRVRRERERESRVTSSPLEPLSHVSAII
jgi:hypothetical protein